MRVSGDGMDDNGEVDLDVLASDTRKNKCFFMTIHLCYIKAIFITETEFVMDFGRYHYKK